MLPKFCNRKLVIACHVQGPAKLQDERVRHYGMQITSMRDNAEVFLVNDVSDPGQRIMWHAMLAGCTIMSPSLFLIGHGPAITYKACLQMKRTIFVSDGFAEEHPILLAILTTRLRHACKWKVEVDQDQFLDRCRRRRASGHAAECMAFLTEGEAKSKDNEAAVAHFCHCHPLLNGFT